MKDPVCGMEVNGTKFKSTYKGKQYEFCSAGCNSAFDKEPEKYA